ncbi:MAG: RNA methyltransferase [Candidatus Babeliales bacterium]
MNIKEITSSTNPEIIAVTKLHSPKGRKARNLFIGEGKRTLQTFAQAGWKPKNIYATEQAYHEAVGIFDSQSTSFFDEKKITLVSNDVMQKISASKSPSGIVAIFAIPEEPSLVTLSAGIVLANITDPGNMGTLLRSAAAFGKKTVVIIEGCDPWSPKVVQASAGTIAHLNIFQISWDTLTENKGDLNLIALIVKDGKKPSELALAKSLLIVGSEAHGIPQEWLALCDHRMTLPMPGNAESLNAAIAGSIALYIATVTNI